MHILLTFLYCQVMIQERSHIWEIGETTVLPRFYGILTLFQSGGCILNPPNRFCLIEARKYCGYTPVMIIVRAELTQQSNKELFNTEQTLTFGSQP